MGKGADGGVQGIPYSVVAWRHATLLGRARARPPFPYHLRTSNNQLIPIKFRTLFYEDQTIITTLLIWNPLEWPLRRYQPFIPP